jgi:hypothetical protein
MVQALKTGVRDHEILQLLGIAYLQEEDYRASAECLRMALELEPKNTVTRDLFTAAVSRRPASADEPSHLEALAKLSLNENKEKVVVSSSLSNETVSNAGKYTARFDRNEMGLPGMPDKQDQVMPGMKFRLKSKSGPAI